MVFYKSRLNYLFRTTRPQKQTFFFLFIPQEKLPRTPAKSLKYSNKSAAQILISNNNFPTGKKVVSLSFSPFSHTYRYTYSQTNNMGSPSIVKSPFFNIAFVLGTMQLSKRINWDDPDTLLYARVGYYSAQVLVMVMAYMLMHLIKKRNGKYHFFI